jgi:hypothetical protein
MPQAGFKSAIPATKRPQTYTLDRAATGIGMVVLHVHIMSTFHIEAALKYKTALMNNVNNAKMNV